MRSWQLWIKRGKRAGNYETNDETHALDICLIELRVSQVPRAFVSLNCVNK